MLLVFVRAWIARSSRSDGCKALGRRKDVPKGSGPEAAFEQGVAVPPRP